MITHVKHTSIGVQDQDRALKFYTEKLDFKVTTDVEMGQSQRWIELDLPGGNTRVILFTMKGQEDRVATFQNIIFATSNVTETYESLLNKGVEFTTPPTKESWGEYAMFKDSEGNEFILSNTD